MDRIWMKASRISDEYEAGVDDFIKFTELNATSVGGKFFCPCVKCMNGRRHTLNDIKSHLICHGINPNYTKWIWHGESSQVTTSSKSAHVAYDGRDHIEDMIRDLGQDTFRTVHSPLYEQIKQDSKDELYAGCTSFTRLSAVLGLVNLKARYGWSDKSFNSLLVLLKEMLPKGNKLPKNHYGNGLVYGFLEPQSIRNIKDKREECEKYIQSWLIESQKEVYLGAYLNQAHWQLVVVCPRTNSVVWFCSLRKRPDTYIKSAINNVMKNLKKPQPNWIEVKSHVQTGAYECGYYVMAWMWNIVSGGLTSDWTTFFADRSPLDLETITSIRQKWAAYMIQLWDQ